MAYDPVRNFCKVIVNGLYNDTATTIQLALGEGNKLPDPSTEGQYNLVWWNATDYSDPSDDPYKEIVRVTAKSGDQITILRGQEGTTAQNHNLPGKTYKMMLTLTKKTYEDLQTIEVYKDGTLVGQRARLNFQNFNDISDNSENSRIDFNFASFRMEDRFGDGSDGDLIISTGTTTLDFQNQNFLIKKYRNLSITGNASLSFTNPHDNGSVAIIYVADTATITSSSVAIDVSGMGAKNGIGVSANGFDAFQIGWNGFYKATGGGGGTTSPATGGTGIESFVNNNLGFRFLKTCILSVGSGGGSGASNQSGATPGNGGRGGGGIILFARKLNFNSTIYANGSNGGNASVLSGAYYAGGGGGGAGGFVVIYAQQIIGLTGTIQAKGGNGGNGAQGDSTTTGAIYYGGGGGACAGNAGANGLSIIPSGFSLTTNVSGGSSGASSGPGKGGGGQGGGGGYILITTI
jgi:hypothetical protein